MLGAHCGQRFQPAARALPWRVTGHRRRSAGLGRLPLPGCPTAASPVLMVWGGGGWHTCPKAGPAGSPHNASLAPSSSPCAGFQSRGPDPKWGQEDAVFGRQVRRGNSQEDPLPHAALLERRPPPAVLFPCSLVHQVAGCGGGRGDSTAWTPAPGVFSRLGSSGRSRELRAGLGARVVFLERKRDLSSAGGPRGPGTPGGAEADTLPAGARFGPVCEPRPPAAAAARFWRPHGPASGGGARGGGRGETGEARPAETRGAPAPPGVPDACAQPAEVRGSPGS